ncbi:MAG TPA: dienelactone hydrolase family protein [Bdellovibrionales bacterium]|nr:dienelactone hydrolase family protein [Bdellovibrionales bacterium]
MNLIIKSCIVAVALAASVTAHAKVVEQRIEYKDGDQVLEGWLYRDDAKKGVLPGVIVVHEWMGVVEHTKSQGRKLAELGYAAFVADIYGKGIRPANTDEARAQATKFRSDRPLLRRRAQAALDTIRSQKSVDKKRIAAIGFCFGGTTVLELARSGAELKGVVSFHGGLNTPTPDDAKNIKGQVLVLHGADDPNVPPEEVQAFQQEMQKGKVNWQLVAFGGAVHSFTNPAAGNDNSKGAAYNATADKRSWEDMTDFFKEVL